MSDTINNMEHTYSLHGHTRSMSSLASTIIPIVSETSPMTVAASSMETDHSLEIPIELKIPLPASSTCSEDGDTNIELGLENHTQTPQLLEAEERPRCKSLPAISDVLNDKSTIEDANMEVAKTRSVTLDELARLVESEQYERRRSFAVRNELGQISFIVALDRRLIHSSAVAYRTMVDQFRASDHGGFAVTHQAMETLTIDCDNVEQSNQICTDHNGETEPDLENWEEPQCSWLQKLPPAYRNGVLTFLTNIRTSPTFLSECISSLSSLELTTLTASYQRLVNGESIFQAHSLSKIRTMGRSTLNKNSTRKVEAIHNFNRSDPYFLLLYVLFDDSLKPGSHESVLRADTWSTTLAKILEDGKQGSDEFALVTLDAFAGFREWNLKPKLEIFLMKIIHEGAFLLDPPQAADFKQPVELQNAQAAVAVSRFFDESLKQLFELLISGSIQNSVPESALNFTHAILGKIRDPRIRLRAKTFITSRWYFSSFISTLLVYPESQGIMTEYHISDTARGTILRELANRMQKQVSDVTSPWTHMTIVTPGIQARVGQFLDIFEPPLQKSQVSPTQDRPAHDHDKYFYPSQLMLSSYDVICLMDFLCPNLSISPTTTDVDSGKALSTASSVTVSSTLTSASVGIGSSIASSVAPSTSGTSLASSTIVGEDPSAESHVNGDVFPISPPKGHEPNTAVLEEKDCSVIQLREISNKIKEGLAPEEALDLTQSAREWIPIYISDSGMKLSLSPPVDEFNTQEKATPTKEKLLDSEIHRQYRTSLKEALISLMASRNFFYDVTLKTQSETAAPSDIAYKLENLFETAMSICQDNLDFEKSFFWWRSVQLLRQISSNFPSKDFEKLLEDIVEDLRSSQETQIKTTEKNLLWRYSLDIVHRNQKIQLQTLGKRRNALRVKMWYVSDVRHSVPYEDAMNVTRALRTMASSRTKQPSSLSNWARHRLRNSFGNDRSDAQMLEVVAAHRDYGGLSKLADEQVELTTRWLTKNSIENFCKGEERIHRFCFEVQKCVNKLAGVNMLDSPVLWASRLFEREKSLFDARLSRSASYDLQHRNSYVSTDAWNQSRLTSSKPIPSQEASSSDSFGFNSSYTTSYPNTNSKFFNPSGIYPSTALNDQSTFKSSSTFTSFAHPPILQNTGSLGYGAPVSEDAITAKKAFAQEVKKTLHSLVISDIGYLLWTRGSETDTWINLQTHETTQAEQIAMESEFKLKVNYDKHEGDKISQQPQSPVPLFTNDQNLLHAEVLPPQDPHLINTFDPAHLSPFPYINSYKMLLDRFSYSPDPYIKLQTLTELESLALSSSYKNFTPRSQAAATALNRNSDPASTNPTSGRSIKIPRTKATSLEEVIANCTERRAGTLTSHMNGRRNHSAPPLPNTDSSISALFEIFQDPSLRPRTLFRDLQYIAAFIPPSILDQTPQGKAFWDAGLAALALKEDICSAMITRATQITTYHISPPAPNPDVNLANTTLRDAARLWLITAKEGSPVAARELGLFYLTHPELLPRITLPFSKAKDVFRTAMGGDQGGGGGGGLLGGAGGGKGGAVGLETGGLDALTFAVVFHWMETAANGGDRDARAFLREMGELSSGK